MFYLFFSPQGFDPLAKEKFVPKYKKKGRSSAGAIERRKKQVAHEEQRVSSPSWEMKFNYISVTFMLYLQAMADLS